MIDLDGVIWLMGQPIEGVEQAIAALRGAGVRTFFATNNSASTRAELHKRLGQCGITATDDDILSSADVAAGLLPVGSSALLVADDGVREALRSRGVNVVTEPPADAVVVGWTRTFTHDDVAAAADAIRAGARLIGTNEDPTYPTPDGLLPGGGSILAMVATASGATPEVAGKPHAPTASAIAARAGDVRVMVGDRPSTDGALATQLSVPFALVLSGVTGPGDDPGTPPPATIAPDLAALVRDVLGL